jgi:two-component system, chemotaxis family, protein-glutamate methylesterase/glutaminase
MSATRVIAIGTSAGGLAALQAIVGRLPPGFPAPLLVVQHVGNHRSLLPELLAGRGPLSVAHAVDREPLRPGHVHVAPPDRHMLVEGGEIRLARGPKEHHARPAVDPLFRSLALTRGPDAVGVVLTGRLDDGTAGLQAIKACGGVAVVQDPSTAEEPGMPASALRYADPDHCVDLESIPGVLVSLAARAPAGAAPRAQPSPWANEQRISLAKGNPMQELEAIGRPSTFVCPDCRGSLWEIRDSRPVRYRCHTGHAYTASTLQHAHAESTDESLWNAVRALQEKKFLLEQLAASHREEHGEELELLDRAAKAARMADRIRDIIEETPGTAPVGD